jgi:rod shape-determining protein MreD
MGGARPLHPGRWLGVPALFCVLATIAFAAPIRIYGLQLPEPVFAMVPAFAWALIRPSILAPFAMLLLGLFLDMFWGGPTGLWGLSLLVAYATALIARNMMTGQSRPMMWAWFGGVTAVAMAAGFLFSHAGQPGHAQPAGRLLAVPGHGPVVPVRPPADRPVRGRGRAVPVTP